MGIKINTKELYRRRLELGWTQADLAAKADVSKRTVENAASNKSVSPTTLTKLARALGCLCEDLGDEVVENVAVGVDENDAVVCDSAKDDEKTEATEFAMEPTSENTGTSNVATTADARATAHHRAHITQGRTLDYEYVDEDERQAVGQEDLKSIGKSEATVAVDTSIRQKWGIGKLQIAAVVLLVIASSWIYINRFGPNLTKTSSASNTGPFNKSKDADSRSANPSFDDFVESPAVPTTAVSVNASRQWMESLGSSARYANGVVMLQDATMPHDWAEQIHALNYSDLQLRRVSFNAEQLSHLPALESLYIYSSNLGDSDLRFLSGKAIKRISFEMNGQLTDASTKWLGEIDNIESLNLRGSQVTDECCNWIRHAQPRIQYLGLAGTRISDEGIADLARLEHLRYLDISQNKFTTIGLRSICSELRLDTLLVVDIGLTSEGIAELAELKGIRQLYVGGNPVTDEEVAFIAQNESIQHLCLYGTLITDGSVPVLMSMKNLKTVNLNGNEQLDLQKCRDELLTAGILVKAI